MIRVKRKHGAEQTEAKWDDTNEKSPRETKKHLNSVKKIHDGMFNWTKENMKENDNSKE